MLIAGRYRLGALLGRGGMGEVYRGTDEVLGRPVAVKLLLRSDPEPRVAERFHREAQAAARLSDPHLVAVYDFGRHGDGFYLVMELVEGRTVGDELAQRGPLRLDEAVDIIEQSAAGLAAAHREDVVHRDIKPGNLLLTADGTVKVADFGIAHLPGSETTTAGEIIGTTHYLAPERAKGLPGGKASDVYALGCVLYQLVTGRTPFTAEHPTAILYQHVDTAPTPPSRLRPELGPPLEDALLRMLAKNPADRPSAHELATGSLRPQRVTATAEAPLAPAAVPAEVEGRHRSFGRKHLLVAAAALLAAVGGVAAGAALDGNGGKPPTTSEIGPPPSSKRSTPVTEPNPQATAPTKSDAVSQAGRTTPTRSSPSTSPPRTPTPSSATTPTEPPSPTTKPSSASQTTPSPTASPTSATPTATPSSTPPSNTPTSPAPPSATPSPPAAQ